MSLEVLVILVPVVFGLMGFGVDLGRLYLVRAELKAAANAMALAAAQELSGTDVALDTASAVARATLDSGSGYGNRYNFGGTAIGGVGGVLSSEVLDPTYYDTLANALESGDAEGTTTTGGPTARYAKVIITAEAPLLFWSFLPLGTERKTAVRAGAVAGISAPLCTACGIEPLAIAPIDAEDTTNFGYTLNSKYTFSYMCTGQPAPSPLSGTLAPYLLLNRYNETATVFADESTQLYRIGAQGLPGSTDAALGCVQVASADGETMWASATPQACRQAPPAAVNYVLCGMWTRFDSAVSEACASIPEVDSLQAYQADTDINDLEEYAAYTGNKRRIITVPIVDALSSSGTMTVLGFRQFLIEPNPGGVNIGPSDADGRFVALYLGSVVPLKAGRFDGCQLAAGPGKVVLHQ